MTKLLNKHWYHLPETEVTDLFDVKPDTGLDGFEIEERRETYGTNTLTVKKSKGPIIRFLLQFHQALIYILLVAIGIKASLGGCRCYFRRCGPECHYRVYSGKQGVDGVSRTVPRPG